MSSNPTPDNDDILVPMAEQLAKGCHTLEVTLGIKQNTEAVLLATIDAVTTASLTAGNAKIALDGKNQLFQAADAAGAIVIKNCRLRLVKLFGYGYSSDWQAAGFPIGSTSVPDSQSGRVNLLKALAKNFTDKPATESVDMEATAAICHTAHDALTDARAAINSATTVQSQAQDGYKAATKSLRKRVRGLIDELGTLIADDDNRYETFGLNIPANPSPPEAIASLTFTALGAGKAILQWTYATRMTGTRVLVKKVGVDADFLSLGTVDGLEKLLIGLTVGQTIEAKVIAYNDGGDAPESPVASGVVS